MDSGRNACLGLQIQQSRQLGRTYPIDRRSASRTAPARYRRALVVRNRERIAFFANAMDPLLSRLEIERALRPDINDGERVRRIAADLVDELGVTAPPVNLEMIASMVGIATVTVDAALTVAGCLVCDTSGAFEIRVRGGDSPRRQRFTVSHECAHTFFPGFATQAQYRCSPATRLGRSLDVEALCDLAASELLFPQSLFVPDLRDTTFGLAGLEELSTRYQGSLEATGHRLVTHWPEPSALLIFTTRQKPSEVGSGAAPKLRLDTAHPNGSWPYFRRHKSATPGDVFYRASQGEIICERTTITGISDRPVQAEIHARLYPLTLNGHQRPRVIALARRG